MYVVYILYSQKFKKTYTGYSNDLQRRIEEHNLLAITGYSIRFRPWIILYTEEFETKKEAMAREKYFKTGVGRELIKKIIQQKYPGY